jgi:hypothetical protein
MALFRRYIITFSLLLADSISLQLEGYRTYTIFFWQIPLESQLCYLKEKYLLYKSWIWRKILCYYSHQDIFWTDRIKNKIKWCILIINKKNTSCYKILMQTQMMDVVFNSIHLLARCNLKLNSRKNSSGFFINSHYCTAWSRFKHLLCHHQNSFWRWYSYNPERCKNISN